MGAILYDPMDMIFSESVIGVYLFSISLMSRDVGETKLTIPSPT